MSAPKTPPPKRLKVFVGDFLEKNSEVPSEASCNDAHISVPGNLKSMKELKLDDDNEQKSQSDTIIDIDDGSQETIGEELTVTSNDRKNMSGKRPNSPLDYDRHSVSASSKDIEVASNSYRTESSTNIVSFHKNSCQEDRCLRLLFNVIKKDEKAEQIDAEMSERNKARNNKIFLNNADTQNYQTNVKRVGISMCALYRRSNYFSLIS